MLLYHGSVPELVNFSFLTHRYRKYSDLVTTDVVS